MTVQKDQPTSTEEAHEKPLDDRLQALGWGLFIIMIGILWLVPGEDVPESTWLLGAGIIMLGLNGVRCLYGIRISGFTVVLGILALVAGVSGLYGVEASFFPILIILVGVSIILKSFVFKGRCCADFCGTDKTKDEDEGSGCC